MFTRHCCQRLHNNLGFTYTFLKISSRKLSPAPIFRLEHCSRIFTCSIWSHHSYFLVNTPMCLWRVSFHQELLNLNWLSPTSQCSSVSSLQRRRLHFTNIKFSMNVATYFMGILSFCQELYIPSIRISNVLS